jgi:hypothetical protein
MTRYRVSEPVHLETHHDTHGSIELTFEGGEYVPRSEQEEAALKHLVSVGFAEPIEDHPAPPEVTHATE